MLVKLRRTWFYPVDAKPLNDKRAISGGRYRKGEHEMPEELRPYLPKDAIILDDKPIVIKPAVMPADPVEVDLDRLSAYAEADLLAEAEATRKAAIQAKRVAALAKAREVKKAKKEAK